MKKYIKYNVVLHNESDFNKCLKSDYVSLDYKIVDVNTIIGITEGRIYIADSMESPVE